MLKSKPKVTRTYAAIHFEDLDPHRFEDLIRQMIYDFRDWKSIEATGKSGNDDGFDIRAYEKVDTISRLENEDGDEIEEIHPMEGNLWMIQGKREKEIGPSKVKSILSDINPENPPYGYILAASANFSKDSYDVFRTELRKKGVMEFYLWGKSELEDMLYMPKNDRILFTFFGFSSTTRKRSRATEIRSTVNVKNKLFRVLGDAPSLYKSILIRDLKDEHYPYKQEYTDFKTRPRWKEYTAHAYFPTGIWFNVHEYFAYVDFEKKEWDFTKEANVLFNGSMTDEERESLHEAHEKIKGIWEFFPKCYQGQFVVDGVVRYEDIVIVDEKGDVLHDLPHIYVDFKGENGPFKGFWQTLKVGERKVELDDTWKRISKFPKKFPKPKNGKIHRKKSISLDDITLNALKNYNPKIVAVYDSDNKYNFLNPRDIISVNENIFIQITNKYKIKIKDYLDLYQRDFSIRKNIEQQLGREFDDNEEINVYEFKQTYQHVFEPKI